MLCTRLVTLLLKISSSQIFLERKKHLPHNAANYLELLSSGKLSMSDYYKLKKLTDCSWINLFEVLFKRRTDSEGSWVMCSRKDDPIADVKPDAVVIIATINSSSGKRLVVTKEFRIPIWDYEYGFPAGLIDDGEDITETVRRELKEETGLDLVKINHISMPVYSSAGLTDESCLMVMVEAGGEVSDE